MLLLRITVLEFSALLQHSIALYCVLENINKRLTVFSRFVYWLRTLQISDRHFLDFEIQINKILIQYPTEKDFLLTCYI
jgi:nitrate reductase cytochrome c-type subunit